MKNSFCKVFGEAAIGYEPRFGYFYCEKHKHVPPVMIHQESLKFIKKIVAQR